MGLLQAYNEIAKLCYLPEIETEEDKNEKTCETIREQELKHGERRRYGN